MQNNRADTTAEAGRRPDRRPPPAGPPVQDTQQPREGAIHWGIAITTRHHPAGQQARPQSNTMPRTTS